LGRGIAPPQLSLGRDSLDYAAPAGRYDPGILNESSGAFTWGAERFLISTSSIWALEIDHSSGYLRAAGHHGYRLGATVVPQSVMRSLINHPDARGACQMFARDSWFFGTGLTICLAALAGCTVHAEPAQPAAPAPASRPAEPAAAEGTTMASEERGEPTSEGAGSGGVVCSGSEDIQITSRSIESNDDGIVVKESCTLRLEQVQVNAGACGIRVTGAGTVIVESSQIAGGQAAVCIDGAGDVRAHGSRFSGRIAVTSAGDFHDEGANQLTE